MKTKLGQSGDRILSNHITIRIQCRFKFNELINEPQQEIFNNVVCATSKASDQPVHMRSLISAIAHRLKALSFKGGCTGWSESTHTVGNHMSGLKYSYFSIHGTVSGLQLQPPAAIDFL